MARYALVRDADGQVLNVIEYDGSTTYAPPAGCSIRLASSSTEVGGSWNGAAFSAPPPLLTDAVFDAAVTQLRNTFNTARTAAQINNSIDALTVILRRVYRELQ